MTLFIEALLEHSLMTLFIEALLEHSLMTLFIEALLEHSLMTLFIEALRERALKLEGTRLKPEGVPRAVLGVHGSSLAPCWACVALMLPKRPDTAP
jgi:hypothetical protein